MLCDECNKITFETIPYLVKRKNTVNKTMVKYLNCAQKSSLRLNLIWFTAATLRNLMLPDTEFYFPSYFLIRSLI